MTSKSCARIKYSIHGSARNMVCYVLCIGVMVLRFARKPVWRKCITIKENEYSSVSERAHLFAYARCVYRHSMYNCRGIHALAYTKIAQHSTLKIRRNRRWIRIQKLFHTPRSLSSGGCVIYNCLWRCCCWWWRCVAARCCAHEIWRCENAEAFSQASWLTNGWRLYGCCLCAMHMGLRGAHD